MNKLLIIIFFAFNFSFEQSIQHEPRKLFVATLNVPQNTRNSNDAFTKFAVENNLKQLLCFRDGQVSSDINFDKNGNIIINYSGDFKVSEHKYNMANRLTASDFYSMKNGHWKNETYEYKNDTILINNDGFLESVIKIDGTEKQIFEYQYQLNEK
ncbi:hypothetical protein KORDIASMS9_04319 [Kordia sp. SMS9]|uniref:hypothetical protein n=1 Tax=Kordia sp. SMS9 TaxID=2282170 RepID=UPI000E0DD3BE|nr:hypothetical protein [Kordia sp. SMS9]AXG72057.1 hypothetical protein KORDIASMS9_04319 [Kordia sp. SMS9]